MPVCATKNQTESKIELHEKVIKNQSKASKKNIELPTIGVGGEQGKAISYNSLFTHGNIQKKFDHILLSGYILDRFMVLWLFSAISD